MVLKQCFKIFTPVILSIFISLKVFQCTGIYFSYSSRHMKYGSLHPVSYESKGRGGFTGDG